MRTHVSDLCESHVLFGTEAISEPLSLPAARIANIDRLRILAAIGVVWFHTESAPCRHIAYAGLPIFLLIFCSLLTSHRGVDSTSEFLKRRWHRLLLPWLFWSAVYGLCRLAEACCTGEVESLRSMLSAETFLAGTSIHLWYLPYAFLWGLIIHALNRRTSHLGAEPLIALSTVAGMALLAIHATGMWTDLPRPLPQWEFGLAAIPLGVALGKCHMVPSRDRQRLLLAGIALIVVVECQVLHWLGFGAAVISHGVAVVLVCLAYGWEIRGGAVIALLAPLAFGVYLIHPLVGHALRRVPQISGSYGLVILLTVSVAALATWILRRTPLKRFV